MKLLNYLLFVLSMVAIVSTSSVNAEWQGEPEISIKTGLITNVGIEMGHGHVEHLFYLDLDQMTRWEIEDFDLISELNWEVGDTIKIYFESGEYYHTAENIDKHNFTSLILIN